MNRKSFVYYTDCVHTNQNTSKHKLELLVSTDILMAIQKIINHIGSANIKQPTLAKDEFIVTYNGMQFAVKKIIDLWDVMFEVRAEYITEQK